MRRTICGLLFLALSAFAQPVPGPDQPNAGPPASGWPRAGEPPATQPGQQPPYGEQDQQPPEPQQGGPQYQQQPETPPAPLPAQLVLQPGTFVVVRVNEELSSDYSHPGDGFSATLVQPLIADGFVVAQRGQTIGGRVMEAFRGGHGKGLSRLGIRITDLTLVDGAQARIQTQLAGVTGPSSTGRDVATVGGTTALGAIIGSAADWGRGAAIGAGAGAAAGIVGVLLMRGHPAVVGPESVVTFRLETPVTISTARAPQAFRYVEPADYHQAQARPRPSLVRRPCGPWGCPPPPYYYGPYYRPYPYYWYGPSFGIVFGGGYWHRGWHR